MNAPLSKSPSLWKQALLTGLALVLVISVIEVLMGLAQYRLSSIALELVRLPPAISEKSEREMAIGNDREVILMHLGVHTALVFIAAFCMWAVIKLPLIGATPGAYCPEDEFNPERR